LQFTNHLAIVSETCGPFTCIPAILNEYRTPELNVRNGCLKALAFVFEYVGEMSKDYIHSVVGLLEDALTDRDHVHRQTACAIVKHLAIGTAGLGYEDALTHLLNLVWPNIFETSPHVIGGVMDAIEAMRLGLGPGVLMSYVLQGMFHPARRVREVYWRMYSTSPLILNRRKTLIYRHINFGCGRRDGTILSPYGLGFGFGFRTGLRETSFDDVGLGQCKRIQQHALLSQTLP
jgi:splicing factor 3B subunit 1